jgi:Spy/CpxP family protein refolding chaperone
MQYKNSLVAIILVLFLVLPLILVAQPEKEIKIIKKQGPMMKHIEVTADDEDDDLPLFSILKLTDEQEKEFANLRHDLQKKQIAARAKVQTAQIELKELFSADNLERALIDKKMKEIADLKLKVQQNRLDHWFAVNKILKEEQQKIWKKHIGKGKSKGFGMMDRRQGFGPKMKMRIHKEMNPGNLECPNF